MADEDKFGCYDDTYTWSQQQLEADPQGVAKNHQLWIR